MQNTEFVAHLGLLQGVTRRHGADEYGFHNDMIIVIFLEQLFKIYRGWVLQLSHAIEMCRFQGLVANCFVNMKIAMMVPDQSSQFWADFSPNSVFKLWVQLSTKL